MQQIQKKKLERRRANAAQNLGILSAAAVSTAVIMYPIDILRAIRMSQAGEGSSLRGGGIGAFLNTHGVRGLFSQGVVAEIGRASVMRVSKFFFFPRTCHSLYSKRVAECSTTEKAIAGALCTVPEILLISPFEVAKVGLQLDHMNKFNNNTNMFLRHQFSSRGLKGMYVGWAGMQYRQLSWSAVFFASLEFYREKTVSLCERNHVPSRVGVLLGGFCAGASGVLVNCPGDVTRTVIQKRGFSSSVNKTYGIGFGSIVEHARVSREILLKRGIRGLYAGFGIKTFHLGCSGALMTMFVDLFSDFTNLSCGV